MRTAPYLAIAATLILWASSFPAIKAGLDGYSPLSLAALLLGAALCWRLFFVLQKPLLTQHSPLEVTCYAVWIGTIALALFLPDAIVELRSASLSATLSALYLGVLPTAGAYLCWAYVLATVPVSQAALYTYLVPVLSAAIAYAWLGEQPSLGFSLGAFSVLLGVVIAHRSRS